MASRPNFNKYRATLYQGVRDSVIRPVLAEVARLILTLAGEAYERRLEVEASAGPGTDPFPVGAIVIYTGAACPPGYEEDTRFSGLMPKGADPSATPGTVDPHHRHALGEQGGSETHTHTIFWTIHLDDHTSSTPYKTVAQYTSGDPNDWFWAASDDHIHQLFSSQITIPTTEESHVPPFLSVLFCRKVA